MRPDATNGDTDRTDSGYEFVQPFRWLLLSGSRLRVAALLSAVVFVALLLVGTTWELQMETLVDETRAVQTLFNTLLGGIILFVSVVLSINTAVLAQELGPLQTKRNRIEDSLQFQTEIETLARGGVSPGELGGFLRYILQALATEAEAIRASAEGIEDPELRREVVGFADEIDREVATVDARLTGNGERVSAVLLAGLDYDYGRHISTARRLREDLRAGNVDDDVAFEDLIEVLKFYATGRDHFTMLYFRREIRKLSGSLLVLSLPVIVFTSYVLLAIDAGLFPSATTLGIQPRLLYVTVAYAVALSPYVLLSAYILRIVTVSKHALRSGPITI